MKTMTVGGAVMMAWCGFAASPGVDTPTTNRAKFLRDSCDKKTATSTRIPAVRTVPHELDVLVKTGHNQGATCSEAGVYLSHAGGIEMIGWDGRLIRRIDAPVHLGDTCYYKGRIYGVFALMGKEHKQQPGMIRVWDAELNLIKEKKFNVVLDGVVVLNDTIYAGVDKYGPKSHPGCCVKRLDLDLNDLGDTDIDLGYNIDYGVQTMATDGTDLFFGMYGATKEKGNPQGFNCSRLTPGLKLIENLKYYCSEGFGLVPHSVAKRDTPVFFSVIALGGNMQGWRKDPVNNPPQLELRFHEYRDGAFRNITAPAISK